MPTDQLTEILSLESPKITLGDGIEYTFPAKMNLNQQSAIQKKFNISFLKPNAEAKTGIEWILSNIDDPDVIKYVLWVFLNKQYPSLTEYYIGEIISWEEYPELLKAITTVFVNSMPIPISRKKDLTREMGVGIQEILQKIIG